MSSDRWTWLWLVVPFAGFGLVGSLAVYYRRRAQIDAWDLRLSPVEPSAGRLVLWAWGIACFVALVFSIYNLLLEMEGTQKGYNIGLWLLGTILGTALALYLGLRRAEPRALPSSTGGR